MVTTMMGRSKIKIICMSENDLPGVADQLLKTFPKSRLFAFYGEMGVGKTTFIKVLCKRLGGIDIVQSPSFSIINEYKRKQGKSVYHFDFYRIRKIEEAYDIGYEEYFYSGSYCFIEWPEMIEPLLPDNCIRIRISETGEKGQREIKSS
jgi:tRNA threonylcarbamoyladenosine biosynthesis protein TsaE